MKFVFIGNGDCDPEFTSLYGETFYLGGPAIEITDEHAIAKLSRNNHFRQGETAEPVPAKRKPGRPPKGPPKIVQVEMPDED